MQGPPGRDGRDGTPGRDGLPGLPGTCSCADVEQIKADIQKEITTLIHKLVKDKCNNSNAEDEEVVNKTVPQTCNKTETDCPAYLGLYSSKPANSCQEIYQCNPLAPSGRYWILTEDDDGYRVNLMYCDMETLLNGTRGWVRVAYINMTEEGAKCPTNLTVVTSPKQLCRRSINVGCSSVHLPTKGLRYSKICGQAVGYQYWHMNAFNAGPKDINSYYVDGMSITYGSPRKHVWTYAVGLSDDYNYPTYNCPCAKVPGPAPPSFVGDHFYCESGATGQWQSNNRIFIEDPLWDGAGCSAGNNCCLQPGMPWFCRTLPQEVEGDIEVRLCGNEANEFLNLELLEIYIQ